MSKQEIIRVLLLADTHLGFDLPRHPRSNRRLRGPDFFDCTRAALSPALRGDADLVIHGGDLLYRSKVRAGLVQAALEPLLEVADTGVPVLLVPGNHERGAIPFPLLTGHPHLHILHHTRTQVLKVDKYTIALGGWPYHREAGLRFRKLLAESTLCDTQADLRLLCVHQAFAGARVEGFRFRADAQTIDARQLPTGIAAVLSGHIHRWQVLEEAPDGSRLAAPLIYPGSVERCSHAEEEEEKLALLLHFLPDAQGGRLQQITPVPLPARPMLSITLPTDFDRDTLIKLLAPLPENSVLRLRVTASPAAEQLKLLSSSYLRELAPYMNISLSGLAKTKTG